MFYRILATLALSFVFYIGTSQISYHRLYETSLNDQTGMMNDTIFYHMSSTTTSGDIYAMGTKRVGDSTMDFEDLSVVFTKHDNKGNIDWSQELDLGIDTIKILGYGSFEFNGDQDSILFSLSIETNGERSELFGRLHPSGSDLELWSVGGLVYSTDNELPLVAPFFNNSDLLVSTGEQPIISRIGESDDLIWSRSYDFTNSNGDSFLKNIEDITTTVDSTIVIVGTDGMISPNFSVAELDSNGVQIWAEAYTFPALNQLVISPSSIVALTNGNFAVAGSYVADVGSIFNGFVAVIDTAGSIIMSNEVHLSEDASTIIDLIEGSDGTLWISGYYTSVDTIKYFTSNLNLDGTSNWTTVYPENQAGFGTFTTDLIPNSVTGGASLVGHGFLNDLAVLQVMKHDVDGTTPCSDTASVVILDLPIVDDTLTSAVVNGGIFFDSLDFEMNTFIGFTPPILTVNTYPPFCPNEVIDTLLIASVSGVSDENISYLWSTGEFTDTIRVTTEGQYSVTVTIVEDVCYSMCDTVELTRLTVPQIAITQDNSRFCEEMIIVLTGNYAPGADGQTFLWNTTEVTETIEVTEPGVYSVTVTDNCDEMASDDVDVSLPVFDPSVFFGANTNDFCDTGTALVTAAYSGGGNEPEFTWSDGQSGNPIIVGTPGTYSVSVTDECGFMTSFTEEIMFPSIATEAEIGFTDNCDEDNPDASNVIFEATGNGDITLATFVVNDDGSQTLVTESNPTNQLQLRNYVLFAFDICGNQLDSLAINTSAICGGIVDFPIVFFPGGQDEASSTFGPIPNDTMNIDRITDVEFKVFNRWGETVFESSAILEAWDGSHKDEPAPSEVYIWYIRYVIDGQEVLEKGDVTLVR